uniref:Calpastatin n=1 Tax=Astyanax mexicanus TaxID=7994 RepID=A0A8B9LPQ0_ASTMX
MGQIFSWFRGSRDTPALQDVAVEEQVTFIGYTTHSEISVRGLYVCVHMCVYICVCVRVSVSTTIPSSKSEPPKAAPSGAAKPSAPANVPAATAQKDDAKSKEAKAAAAAVDPFDALAGSLPSSEPLAPKPPKYTGPEVKEPGLTSKEAKRCGEHDFTLPPGYRKEDMVSYKTITGLLSNPLFQLVKLCVSVSLQDDPMSLDALSALSDSLPSAKPVLESPKLRPEDIVKEKEAKSEKGVRVGEREDSLPPEYRFPKEKLSDKPAPPKEPSMDSGEALDILSGDFSSPSVAPAVKSSAPPSAPAKKVSQNKSSGESMSLDALSALEDLLPAAKPVPESPKLRPEDIIDEKELTSEKGVRVGEREDTLPPEYRFPKEDPKKHPTPPQREPSLDSAGALDILSGDFTSSSAAPAVKSSADFALDELAADFVAPTSASKVQSAVTGPPKADRQVNTPLIFSHTNNTRVQKRTNCWCTSCRINGLLMGLTSMFSASLFSQVSMDETAALDLLSGDFTSSSAAAPVAPPSLHSSHSTPAKTQSAAQVLNTSLNCAVTHKHTVLSEITQGVLLGNFERASIGKKKTI